MLPQLGQVEEKFRDEVVVIGVHSGKFTAEHDNEVIRSALLRYGLQHPVINDHEFKVWQAYATRAWPTLFFIDPRGYLVGKHEGEATAGALERVVGEMVAEFDAAGLIDRRPLHFQRERAAGETLSFPGDVLVDPNGERLLISDTGHHRLLLADLQGQVQAVIGDGAPGLQDGGFASARFNQPQGLALAGDTLYVADSHNHAIRRVDLRDHTVSTVAGTGEKGEWGATAGPATSVALRSPWDVLLREQQLIIAMAGSHQVWALDLANAEVGVLAGAGPERLDDGDFGAATFAQPYALASHGSYVYVADSESSSIRRLHMDQRRVDTLVGLGLFEWGDKDGVGTEARLQHPGGLAFAEGYLYIADTYNHKLKRMHADSTRVETLAAGGLHEPAGLCAHDGRLYVADAGNHAVRVVNLATGAMDTLAVRL